MTKELMGGMHMGVRKQAGKPKDEQQFYVHIGRQDLASPDGLVDPIALCGLVLGRITFLCAETGMGKSHIARCVAKEAEEQKLQYRYFDMATLDRQSCCDRLVRSCRNIARMAEKGSEGVPKVVIFDNVAPGDESEVHREASALTRAAHCGSCVLVCIRPEAEQLVEALPHAKVLRADELLYRTEGEANAAQLLSHGIPLLVEALRVDVKSDVSQKSREEGGPNYLAAMETLVAAQLREGLCDEEYRLRLAMILLGCGSLEDVATICGRFDHEQALWMQRNAPFFQVDANAQTFCCAGICEQGFFARVSTILQAACAREPELVMHACGMLCVRGNVVRSALLCKLSSSEGDVCSLGCRWGVAYIQVGEVQLVATSLSSAARLGVREGNRAILSEVALACVRGTAREVEVAKERLYQMREDTQHEALLRARVEMMVAARDLCRNPQLLAVRALARPEGTVPAPGAEHVRMLGLLLEGAFSEAYAELANAIMLRRVDTLSEALLSMDLQVAVALTGGSLDGSERWLVEGSQRFFAHMPPGRLRRYHASVSALAEVLMGSSKGMQALEDAAAQAERVGDTLLQAVFLTAAAVGDLRSRTFSRARVRATHAATLARAAESRYLVSAADLVCALSLTMLGESGSLESYCLHAGRPKDLHTLGALAARAAGEAGQGSLFPMIPLGTPCPKDALWALNMIAYDCGSLSEEVRRLVPASWLELLKLARMRQAVADEVAPPDEIVDRLAERGAGRSTLAHGSQSELIPYVSTGQRVRVKVLGGFGVWVDGERVADHRFERRRARDLIELLAIAPSHRLRRYQVARAIWPDEDYYRGPRRLYEATGEARKLLGGCQLGVNAIVADKAQGALGYDRAIVSCDVDDFEREVQQTLLEDRDDFWVLDHARQMCRIYAGGPDAHIESLGDEAVGRLLELEDLFVDGLVAAGEAALRLSKARLAVRYATDAYHMRDLREDTVILLAQAFKVSGRGGEIGELYQHFSHHLMEAKGVLPSLALRQVVEHSLGGLPDALSA